MSEDATYRSIEQKARESGAAEAIAALVDSVSAPGREHELFDALMLRCRFDCGLPLHGPLDVASLSQDDKNALGRAQDEACRTVGASLLARGDVTEAWPYFRNVGEIEPIRAAIEKALNSPERGEGIEQILELAWDQGLHPRAGFDEILEHHGLCDAIHSLERKLPEDPGDRRHCITGLIRSMHQELLDTLRKAVAQHESEPASTDGVRELVGDRRWLFRGGRSHVDDSHLRAAVRFSIILESKEDLEKACDLAWYGAQLPMTFQQPEPPPFESFYDDYRVLLEGLSGEAVDAAVEHFQTKLDVMKRDQAHRARFPAEVLVLLLSRVGRPKEAIDVSLESLGVDAKTILAPPLIELCRQAGDYTSLKSAAEQGGQLVAFTAALLSGSENR